MRLKDDIYYLQQELGDIKQESIAMEMLKDYKKQNHRLFIIILVILGLWFATGMYLIYILNDIGVEEITETSTIDMDADGSNNYIGGDNNGTYESN